MQMMHMKWLHFQALIAFCLIYLYHKGSPQKIAPTCTKAFMFLPLSFSCKSYKYTETHTQPPTPTTQETFPAK